MPVYDNTLFNPPAPLAQVTLHLNEGGEFCRDVLMLLDSGADVTLLPARSVRQLGVDLESAVKYELIAFDGSISIAHAIFVDLHFLKRIFKGRFLVINQEYGILGRDILNHLFLQLNGPKKVWEVVSGNHRIE